MLAEELQWASRTMPDAMAQIVVRNIYAAQGLKSHNPAAYQSMVLLEELGMRAFQSLRHDIDPYAIAEELVRDAIARIEEEEVRDRLTDEEGYDALPLADRDALAAEVFRVLDQVDFSINRPACDD